MHAWLLGWLEGVARTALLLAGWPIGWLLGRREGWLEGWLGRQVYVCLCVCTQELTPHLQMLTTQQQQAQQVGQ